ncbi:RecB family exonuclease [Nakamurella silvestris]|nr:RecB family exonuclease [Nakamurella silvestris]
MSTINLPAPAPAPADAPHPAADPTLPTGGADGGPVAGPGDAPLLRRPLALSPSRAQDFKQCPLLYRFRTIDRLPEPPSPAAVRGTLVHAVLEDMFGRPAAVRTPDATAATVDAVWERLRAEHTEWEEMVGALDEPTWLDSARTLVRTYFTLEDPTRFDADSCEMLLEVSIDGEVPLRGYVDRIDVAPTGQVRVVDYKTGKSPGEGFEGKAMYQLKFYALMLWRLRGVIPTQLKLLYLADAKPLTYGPSEQELVVFERMLGALWRAIGAAIESGDFRPQKTKLCGWCNHQALCPEFGGTPPPYPGAPAVIPSGN